MSDSAEMLTVTEVCDGFRVSRKTVLDHCRDGKIKGATQDSRGWQLPLSSITWPPISDPEKRVDELTDLLHSQTDARLAAERSLLAAEQRLEALKGEHQAKIEEVRAEAAREREQQSVAHVEALTKAEGETEQAKMLGAEFQKQADKSNAKLEVLEPEHQALRERVLVLLNDLQGGRRWYSKSRRASIGSAVVRLDETLAASAPQAIEASD